MKAGLIEEIQESSDKGANFKSSRTGTYMGLIPYRDGLNAMDEACSLVKNGHSPMKLLLLQHNLVVTLGKRAGHGDLKLDATRLRERGIGLEEVSRGGLATYHGPGQLVGYPVMDLRKFNLGPRKYIARLEEFLLGLLKSFNVDAHCKEQERGVWCQGGKIAFIGVRISRGIASHGFSLNVCLDLEPFSYIIPCGVPGEKITSMSIELGEKLTVEEVALRALEMFTDYFPVSVVNP